jgi:hypothetical protein
MSTFASPASTSGVDWNATKGHLLLITPLSLEEGVNTSLGAKDAIRADVVDLNTGDEYSDVLVFPRVLIGQMRSRIGQKVLGRLGQGVAKVGQSAPWVLQDFTAADAQKAQAYIDRQSKPAFSAPGSDGEPF